MDVWPLRVPLLCSTQALLPLPRLELLLWVCDLSAATEWSSVFARHNPPFALLSWERRANH